MKVPFNDLSRIHKPLKNEFHNSLDLILENSSFVLGDFVRKFELEFAKYEDFKYCISVDNGTNAIELALRSININPGDEVIIPGMTFIATAFAVLRLGAKPVLVDTLEDSPHLAIHEIEKQISKKTKAIIYVSLHGTAYNLDDLLRLKNQYGINLVLDGAQSHGFRFNNKSMSKIFDLMTSSFYPGKNLGSLGEGGAVLCNSEEIANKIRVSRDWGAKTKYAHDYWGGNFRLHALQAEFLMTKLKHLDSYNNARKLIARRYHSELNPKFIRKTNFDSQSVFHIFEIKVNDRLNTMQKLQEVGIQTAIHYPMPLNKIPILNLANIYPFLPNSTNFSESTLSIPLFPYMLENEINYVIENVNKWAT